jgi:hypothetical protein
MTRRGRGGSHGGCSGECSGCGCRRGQNYTGARTVAKSGLCAALDNNVFDSGHRAAADQMRTSWEKLVQFVGTNYGQDISNELQNKIPVDKICMMMTRLACNRAVESSYWRMDNNSDVGLLTGYVLYRLPIELESMDLDTFSR